MVAPLRYRLRAQSCRYGAADWGRGQRRRPAAKAFGGAKQRILVKATAPEVIQAALPAAARQSNLRLQHCDHNQKQMEETMNIDRRQLALPVLALGLGIGLMSVVPAFAGADE